MPVAPLLPNCPWLLLLECLMMKIITKVDIDLLSQAALIFCILIKKRMHDAATFICLYMYVVTKHADIQEIS